nr:replication protein A 70 kDa DNA-binding subunit D [Tanacetum cinerariifolium]
MRTRSSSNIPVESSPNIPVESSPNPTTSNPKRRNRRRSKQPFILEESPVDTMADQRTMAELLRASTEGYAEAIVVPPILAEQFELKHSLINMMASDYKRTILMITSAWDRYKDLLRTCPHHGFTELHKLDTFYNALNPADQDSLKSAAGGNLLERCTQDVLTIIENKSKFGTNLYFREDIVVLMRNSNVIPNTESYKFTNLPYKISFDRFSFARRSNTFNGDVNNTGFEVTKFCVIRSLNLDTDLPIGEVISWEYELREYEVYGSKVKVKEKFLVNVENARVFDDGKGGCQGSECEDDYYFHNKFVKFYVLKNRPLTFPSKFVSRHRINEFKVAILLYGNKDFQMELNQNIVKLSKGNKKMYLTMEGDWIKFMRTTGFDATKDKREVMEEDKEAVVLDVNFVKIVDMVKPEVDVDVNNAVQLDEIKDMNNVSDIYNKRCVGDIYGVESSISELGTIDLQIMRMGHVGIEYDAESSDISKENILDKYSKHLTDAEKSYKIVVDGKEYSYVCDIKKSDLFPEGFDDNFSVVGDNKFRVFF